MPNLAVALRALADLHPERDCIRFDGGRRVLSWSEVAARSGRLGRVLTEHGLGATVERDHLAGWQLGQDVVALVAFNGPEYLEAMVGSYGARCVPVNVSWRYTAEEMAGLFADCRPAAIVAGASLLDTALDACDRVGLTPRLVLVVDDGAPVTEGAARFDDVVADGPVVDLSACRDDDVYALYTGGTTGAPRAALWRQDDFCAGALGITGTTDALVERARRSSNPPVALPLAPFMHGAAHWNALSAWLSGGTVCIQRSVRRLDPADAWDTAAACRATSMQVVGDAFARPLVDELRARPRPLPHLRVVMSGGAVLSPAVTRELFELLPEVTVLDIVGSSESGRLGVGTVRSDSAAAPRSFRRDADTTVISDDRTRELEPGTSEVGWLANAGRVPLGYLNDPAKTERTFPIVGGRRMAVPGDQARLGADGTIELLGRAATVITTGGEKVFAEEVEQVLKHHPAVLDALVVGRPHPRWGNEVVAVVALRGSAEAITDDAIIEACEGHLARYKWPRAIVRRPAIARSPSGKPDYAWAAEQVR